MFLFPLTQQLSTDHQSALFVLPALSYARRHRPRDMEEDEQPCPLHIVKRDSDASCSSSRSSHASQRKASSGTNESWGSAREMSGMDLPLAVPKKRKAMLFRHGERFESGASVAAYRRSMNLTDNFGDHVSNGSDSGDDDDDDDGRGSFRSAEDDGFTSVRLRYLQDGQMIERGFPFPSSLGDTGRELTPGMDTGNRGEGTASQLPRHIYEHVSYPYLDGMDSIRSKRAEGDAGADKEAEDASYLHQMDILRRGPSPGERFTSLGDNNESGSGSGKIKDMLHRCPSYEYVPRTGLSAASTSHTYGRATSTNTPPEVETVSLSPFERPATAIPFRSHGQHHHQRPQQQYYQHHTQHPRTLPHIRPGLPFPITEPLPGPDPQMLTPIITITPERRSVGGSVSRFWVAVELHAQITRPLDGGSSREYPFSHSSRQTSISGSSKDNAGTQRLMKMPHIRLLEEAY